MDASGLLTVFAVLLTGATLLPKRTLLDLKIRISWMDKLIFGSMGVFSLYLLFLDVLKANDLSLPIPWLLGFNKESSLLATSILMILMVTIKIRETKLAKSNIFKLEKEIDQLIRDGNFNDISYLIEKYLNQLIEYKNIKPWKVKLHDYIQPSFEYHLSFQPRKDKLTYLKSKTIRFRVYIANFFPSSYWLSDKINEMMINLFKSRALTYHIAENYPVLGFNLLQNIDNHDSIRKNEFAQILLKNCHSPIYRELSSCQYITSSNCYEIDPSNPILNFLFKDIKTAEELEIHEPIKEFITTIIKKENTEKSIYNNSCDDFITNDERWVCPIYISILFFDIMIREGIEQKSEKHLFPNYLFHIAKEIINSIERSDNVDLNCEFPTRYDYLLYESMSTMAEWIRMVEERRNTLIKYDPYLILESFGMLTNFILKSDKFSNEKKAYFFSIVLRTIQSLDNNRLEPYSKEVVVCVKSLHSTRPIDAEIMETIEKLHDYIRIDDSLLLSVVKKYFSVPDSAN